MAITTKADILEGLRIGTGVLFRAEDDEPIFVLRARDAIAPAIVEKWAADLIMRNNFDGFGLERVQKKVGAALKLANDMREWQAKNGVKVPD